MTRSIRGVLALTLSFAIAALLSQAIFYDTIDRLALSTFNDNLLEYQAQIKSSVEESNPNLWQQQTARLSDELNTPVYLDKRDLTNFTEDILEQLYSPIGDNGIIDPDMGLIYYPVSAEYALTVGPFDDMTLAYAAEIFTWLFALLTAIATFILLDYQDKKSLKRLSDSLCIGDTPSPPQLSIESLQAQAELMSVTNRQKSTALDQLLITQRDLLHGVAHEFRSPLARMEFAIELLEEADEDKRLQLKGQLERSIKELDELVKQVLRYSRLQHDGAELELNSIGSTELIERSVEKVQHFYPNIRFNIDDLSQCQFRCDIKLMVIALSNILRNAGRFAHTRCLITVESHNDTLTISIQDDGPGLAPGKKKQIFEPFTRLDPSRSRDSGGYGLGLAIVQSIVHKHDGSIKVEDAPIGGANFIITLAKPVSD
ncbi:ATP-binding protein [uncultured Shewanella sp.]|uniref:sensor histidine kinase n=1 Tax=uncultured Shewanella sp. TaxID=173975 RepID=UPI002620192D|nr:ATP-binding protein [uncultured Shewanella sp.]